jgi:hypothetical protein
MNTWRPFAVAAVMMAARWSYAAAPSSQAVVPWTTLGDLRQPEAWQWREFRPSDEKGPAGNGSAALAVPGEAVFGFPDGPKGWHKRGFRVEHDGTRDWRDEYGLQLDVRLAAATPVELSVRLRVPGQPVRMDYVQETKATVTVQGAGWHRVTLPWSAFDFAQAQPAFLKFVKEVHLATRVLGEGSQQPVLISDVRVIRAPAVALVAPVQGRAAGAGAVVEYPVTVTNCTDRPQSVNLSFQTVGWEAMTASVDRPTMQLAPGETQACLVRVKVSDRIPPGGHQTQVLRAVANGDAGAVATLAFTTACEVPHPNILHTQARWREVRDKVAKHDWAREEQARLVKQADGWNVPEIAQPPKNDPGDQMGPFLFSTREEINLLAAAVAYQLTGEKKYAEKVATFLRRLSDPERGYPKTLRGCNQSLVQEGHLFQHNAMAYDMIADSGVLTAADRAQVERTFRLYIETIRLEAATGSINNWNLSELCGALYCALAVGDLSLADRYLNGANGILEHLSKGVMDDGWWYECSISYNVWCAAEFSQVALAMEPWGVNLKDARVPASYTPNYSIIPWAKEPGLYGMNFDKFGPVTHNHVDIKRMWDALPRFADFNGLMFGLNDSTERPLTGTRTEVGGQPFEIAYYLYRDPAYAAIIKRAEKRDLLYGVPELPDEVPDVSGGSAYADNVGVVMLRSQAADRPRKDQLQAVLHYGTHGGFHGHFDRTNLLSLMRYGRSFYNPEMIWYGYESFLYKFYVQSSINKNMVTVDLKMQEPVESQRLLFHTGTLFQATAVQTNARWSHEPFGGMIYDWFKGGLPEKQWAEGRSFPLPADAPKYSDIGAYSDRVLQRRLMVVTDDYVVLADYLKGDAEHTFDNLYQIRGFRGLEAGGKKPPRHTGQMTTDPRCAAQFITDCDWYDVTSPARATFDDPAFKVDVISVWPVEQQVMVGTAPDVQKTEKQLSYAVRGDGKTLAEGKFGAWVLGQAEVDVPLDNVSELELETRVAKSQVPSVFWGNARVVTRDGKELPLASLPVQATNVMESKSAGTDYAGGPVKIVGVAQAGAVAAQPKDDGQPATLRLSLSGLNAARFKATLGGDYPVGDEGRVRKTYSVRTRGRVGRFLTVVEPHDGPSVIKRATALDAGTLRVELTDGRIQEIRIDGLDGDGASLAVHVTEKGGGKAERSESRSASTREAE